MSRPIAREPDTLMFLLLVVVEYVYLIECALQVFLIKQLLIYSDIGNLHEILHHIVVYLPGRVRHIDSAFEVCLGQEVWQTRAVVHMEVRHEDKVHVLWIDNVEIRQCLYSFFARMDTAVHQNFATFTLYVDARATYFITRAERRNFQKVTTRCLYLMRLDRLVELLSQGLNIHYYLL